MNELSETAKRSDIELRELLLEEDEDFIEAAYLALLKRRPDARGGPAYLRALRAGEPKLDILHRLFTSGESRRAGVEIPGLIDAFAREGIGDYGAIAKDAATIRNAEQLLVIDDAPRFIDLAYRILLNRKADPQGAENCSVRMSEGISKAQILLELYVSPERAQLGTQLPGLAAAVRREGLDFPEAVDAQAQQTPPATTLAELLNEQGVAFIQRAHETLMGDGPVPEFADQLLGRLRSGDAKLHLLLDLSSGPQGALRVQSVKGLAAALLRYRVSRIPVLGGLVRLFGSVDGDSPAERGVRANAQRMHELELGLAACLRDVEAASQLALRAVERSDEATRDIEVRVASLERSSVSLRQLLQGRETVQAVGVRQEEVFRELRKLNG